MSSSEWTHETLRVYVVSLMDERDRRYAERFSAQGTAMDAALQAAKEALNKADTVNERRLEHLNQFKAAMQDQAMTYMPRKEVDLLIGAMEARLSSLTTRVDAGEGIRAGKYAAWLYVVSAVSVIGVLLTLVMRTMKP